LTSLNSTRTKSHSQTLIYGPFAAAQAAGIAGMGGPNLEVFKVSRLRFGCLSLRVSQFAIYILFPIGIMYHFGTNLDRKFSVPGFWPSKEQSHRIPTDPADLDEELDRLRAIRLEIRRRRLELDAMDKGEVETIQRPNSMEKPNSSTYWKSPRGREG